MENTIQKIPFLRITFALAIGIVLGSLVTFPYTKTIVILIFIAVILVLINKNYSYKLNTIFGVVIHLFFILLGFYLFHFYNDKPIFYESGKFSAIVLEVPQEKPNSFKSVIQINSFQSSDSVLITNEKVIAYFSKEDNVTELKPGDIILCNQIPQFIKNSGNPYEFDYKKYLELKKMYRQVYIAGENWKKTNKKSTSVLIQAENFREKLLSIYRNQSIDDTELEILSALTLGYKRDLDADTKRVFSSAGAMHVLAVSGLHVGIIFWIITILFGFLRRQKTGRLFFVSITILILWGYAFITGLSPSVMRAAAMFSIYIIGENLNRRANVYNSLAASALFLLLINPNNLFDLGFQFSYSAVFGIVFLQPKLSKILEINNKVLQFFWSLFTVSIAAQVATFPLSIYYFNQFPSYFWITNSFVIPSVMILIPLGIMLLFLSKVSVLATLLSFILNYLIKLIYLILSLIEQLPFSVLQVSITPMQLALLSFLLIAFFIFLKSYHQTAIKFTLFFTFSLIVSILFVNIKNSVNNEIIIYNSSDGAIVQLIHGRKNIIISDNKIETNERIYLSILTTKVKMGLDVPLFFSSTDTVINENLFLKNRNIFFEGKTVLIGEKIKISKNHPPPDFHINPGLQEDSNDSTDKVQTIITNKRYYHQYNPTKQNIHLTYLDGAFREKW